MARFLPLVALCVTAFSGARAASPLSYGMSMSTRAFEAVCWYESLKVFPKTYSDQYGHCGGQSKSVQDQIEHPDPQNKAYMESSPSAAEGMFGSFFSDLQTLDTLPGAKDYKSKCQKFLKDAKAEPTSDESDVLNDKAGSSYPYKAFAYCLMKTLKERHGDKAFEAVKGERTYTLKNWMQTLLDRDNEFRARHGAPPLKLVKDLNEAAQQWADTNANECNMYHSEGKNRHWRGDQTGESLSSGGGEDNARVAAYLASDGWYEEIGNYPYPDGYQGDGNDKLFEKIGHFTQTVWNDTTYVGYGYAYNKACGDGNFYIAARYFPAGNMPGAFSTHVYPPK